MTSYRRQHQRRQMSGDEGTSHYEPDDVGRYETWKAAALAVSALAVRYEIPDDDIDLTRAIDKLREIAPPKPGADEGEHTPRGPSDGSDGQ